MENNKKRKRQRGVNPRSSAPGAGGAAAKGGKRPPGAPTRTTARTQPPARTQPRTTEVRTPLSELGIDLNAESARKAIILSEIIGKPVSKRKRGR